MNDKQKITMKKSYIKPQLRSVVMDSYIICTSPDTTFDGMGGKDNPTGPENPSGDAKRINWFDEE